jgi:hypothetical protein
MDEADIALAFLFWFDPIWLGDLALFRASRNTLLNTVRRGRASADAGGERCDGGSSNLQLPRKQPRATETTDDLSGGARAKRSVRFCSPPIELRRGFRERPSPTPHADHRGDPSLMTATPSAAKTSPSVVQSSLSGCRRAVASTLRRRRPRMIASRVKRGSSDCGNSATPPASTTTSSFMASFKAPHGEIL